jgi:hypothetical protein
MPLGPNGYDLTVMHSFRGSRVNSSMATNGHYFAGPLTHFAINTTCVHTDSLVTTVLST